MHIHWKLLVVAAVILTAATTATVTAQPPSSPPASWLYLWTGGGPPRWLQTGPGLTVTNNIIDVAPQPAESSHELAYDPVLLGWVLPAATTSVRAVYLNGIRLGSKWWTATGGVLKLPSTVVDPTTAATHEVIVDIRR